MRMSILSYSLLIAILFNIKDYLSYMYIPNSFIYDTE